MALLGGRRFQVSDEITTLIGLLEASEDHLGAGDVLLWIFQILEEGVLAPGNSLSLVGIGVRESSGLTSFTAEDSVQIRADLVLAASFDSVALRASLNEDLLSLLNITSWYTHVELRLLELHGENEGTEHTECDRIRLSTSTFLQAQRVQQKFRQIAKKNR